jgi:hypothetical protein
MANQAYPDSAGPTEREGTLRLLNPARTAVVQLCLPRTDFPAALAMDGGRRE